MTSGCSFIDHLMGDVERDVITTIYGPGGCGKTLACMLVAAEVAKTGKVLYIDTEGGFSVERLKQVTGEDFNRVLDNFIFLKPTSFADQRRVFDTLKETLSPEVKLIVVDTIAMLYRLELGRNEEIYETNRELGRQISVLTELSRTRSIPVMVTNQVYSNLDNNGGVKMVGGDILVYGSKCLIEIAKGHNGKRKAILRKHRSQKEKEITFTITQTGIDSQPLHSQNSSTDLR